MSSGREPLRVTQPGPASGPILSCLLATGGTALSHMDWTASSPTCPLCPYGWRPSETATLHEPRILPVASVRPSVTATSNRPNIQNGWTAPRVAIWAQGGYFLSRFLASQWAYVCLFPPLWTGNRRIQLGRRWWASGPVSCQQLRELNDSPLYLHIIPFYPQKKNPGLRILVFETVKAPSVAIENFNLTSSQQPQVLSGYLYSCCLVSLRMRPTKGLGLAHRGHRRQAAPPTHISFAFINVDCTTPEAKCVPST